MLVSLYRRRRRGIEISLGEPFPVPSPKPEKKLKNIARFALEVKTYLAMNPDFSHTNAAEHFNVSRARISQLIKIANETPIALLKQLFDSNDQALLKKYSGKCLLKMCMVSVAKI